MTEIVGEEAVMMTQLSRNFFQANGRFRHGYFRVTDLGGNPDEAEFGDGSGCEGGALTQFGCHPFPHPVVVDVTQPAQGNQCVHI
jgi:hypothetical protein